MQQCILELSTNRLGMNPGASWKVLGNSSKHCLPGVQKGGNVYPSSSFYPAITQIGEWLVTAHLSHLYLLECIPRSTTHTGVKDTGADLKWCSPFTPSQSWCGLCPAVLFSSGWSKRWGRESLETPKYLMHLHFTDRETESLSESTLINQLLINSQTSFCESKVFLFPFHYMIA